MKKKIAVWAGLLGSASLALITAAADVPVINPDLAGSFDFPGPVTLQEPHDIAYAASYYASQESMPPTEKGANGGPVVPVPEASPNCSASCSTEELAALEEQPEMNNATPHSNSEPLFPGFMGAAPTPPDSNPTWSLPLNGGGGDNALNLTTISPSGTDTPTFDGDTFDYFHFDVLGNFDQGAMSAMNVNGVSSPNVFFDILGGAGDNISEISASDFTIASAAMAPPITEVPEPWSLTLLVIGLCCMGGSLAVARKG